MSITIRTKYIDDAAVTTQKIADDAVTTDKIADGAVTAAKLGVGAVGITQLTGDATTGTGGGVQASTVVALQGQPVSATAPSTSQVLQWNGTAWVPGVIPNGGSGGGGIVYYLNQGTAAEAPTTGLTAPTVKQLGLSADTGSSTATKANVSTGGTWDQVAGFVTDVGVPGTDTIPAGLWDFNIWVASTAATNAMSFRATVYKYDGFTVTQIGQSSAAPIYDPTNTTQYVLSVLFSTTSIQVTERVYVVLEATCTASSQSVTFSFGDGTPAHVHTTIPSVTGTGVVHVINGVVQSPATAVSLTADVSGTLPVGNGGTGITSAGTAGNILVSNGSGLASVAVSGDATLTSAGSVTVTALQNVSVATTAPTDTQVLAYNAGTGKWAPTTTGATGSAGGDLTGNYPNPTIAKLQGTTVSASSPASGQYLGYNGSAWAPVTPTAGITQLSGDVTTGTGGGLQSASVVRIQGNAVSSTTPTTTGQALIWNALSSQWAPGTATAAGSAGGDLSGTYPNPTVAKIQGSAVSSTAPTLTNKYLIWSGTAWTPGALSLSGISAGGDLSGTYPNPTVAALLGRALNTTAPTTNQAYVYDGSQWTATGVAKSGAWSLTGITGSNDGLPIFNASGSPTVLAPPTSKTNSVLGWLSDGTMGWVGMLASVLLFAGVTAQSDSWFIEANSICEECPANSGPFTATPGGYFDTATGIV